MYMCNKIVEIEIHCRCCVQAYVAIDSEPLTND